MNLEIIETVFSKISESDLEDSQRLLHGRGRVYPGFEQISIDWFEPVILISLYKEQKGFDLEALKLFIIEYFQKKFPRKNIEAIVAFEGGTRENITRMVVYANSMEDKPEIDAAYKGETNGKRWIPWSIFGC